MRSPQTIDNAADVLLHSASSAPSAAALIAGDRIVTHGELGDLVAERAAEVAGPRSLVIVPGARSIDFVVEYLALLSVGHVPLLADVAHADEQAACWAAGPHDLHPDLALLMSTSGSTGSPKLVRLSHRNVVANARSIIDALAITSSDRAITSLPLQYCYGLSVLHSHLAAGASIVLTEASVVDPCFREALVRRRVTNFAGVPHTFELLERSGFDATAHPDLRFVTQAGGRMVPDRVAHWDAVMGPAKFIVMYGQTEATARMAVLDPALTGRLPFAIGSAVPGGELTLRAHPAATGADEGELVYCGPNVMMGYATTVADLASGHELDELATGDLARFHPAEGVFEVIGRASRFVKPFGVRIDLDRVEALVSPLATEVAVAGTDEFVAAAVVGGDVDAVRGHIVRVTGLPSGAVRVVVVDEVPRTPNGKVDHGAITELGADDPTPVAAGGVVPPAAVVDLYRLVLGVAAVAPTDTFVGLGGDSLSYVECSLRLEELIGILPPDWHVRTVAELSGASRSSSTPRLDTTVVLRAVGICAVVATHMHLRRMPGGAHTLLAVVGYNFARFQLSVTGAAARLRAGLRSAARVAIPATAWIGANMLVAGGYSIGALLLVNNYTGSSWRRDGRWQYWFFETFVQLMVITTALVAIPAVQRFERRAPYAFAWLLLGPLLVLRFELLQFGHAYNYLFRTHTVAWFFALGWLIFRSTARWQRVVASLLIVATVPGFFGQWYREGFIVVALLLLTWVPALPIPRLMLRPVSVLAAASMWIFLVHWQLFEPLDRHMERELAYVLTLAIGAGVWWAATRLWRAAVRIESPMRPTRVTTRVTTRVKGILRV